MTTFRPRELKAHNGYDTKQASDDACTHLDQPEAWGPSLTVQSHAIDADINVIVERFGITGKMPDNVHVPSYGDFSEVMDYRSALEAVRHADEQFMLIPAKIRAQFDNDPQKFLEFSTNPANLAELRSMGLAKPAPAPQPTPAPGAPPSSAAVPAPVPNPQNGTT